MNQKNRILLVLICFSTIVISQNKIDISDRSGKLYFKIGADYRITPLYQFGLGRENDIRTNVDRQNSGAAISYGLEFFPWEKLSFNFSQSFHYTLFHYESYGINEIEQPQANGATHSLFVDYHLYVNYYLKIFKKGELFLRAGRSLLNRNSNYTSNQPFFNDDEFIGSAVSENNFNVTVHNFAIGYKKNKVEVLGGIYSTSDTPYFNESSSFIIPYLNLTYTIGKM